MTKNRRPVRSCAAARAWCPGPAAAAERASGAAVCGCGLLRAPSSPRSRTFPAFNDADAFDGLSRCAFPRRSARPSCRRSTSTPLHSNNSPAASPRESIHTPARRPAPASRVRFHLFSSSLFGTASIGLQLSASVEAVLNVCFEKGFVWGVG